MALQHCIHSLEGLMVLEKDGEHQLDRPCEKWSVAKSQGGEGYSKIIKRNKANFIGHILCRNCLLKHVIGGKIEGRIEVTEGRGRRCKQLLDYLKEKRGYWKLKAEALDRTLRKNCCGRGYGRFVRQTTEWMIEFIIFVFKKPSLHVTVNSNDIKRRKSFLNFLEVDVRLYLILQVRYYFQVETSRLHCRA